MGLSVNEFIYAGDNEFTLNFAMGYASRSDVTAYKVGDPPVDLSFDWLTDNQVRLVSGQSLVNGDIVVFRRTVSKQALPVDLTQPGEATRENLETMFKHSIYVSHEVLDERADFIPSNELILPVSKGGTGANNATGAALNLGILAGINILAPENNLSDIENAAVALSNLGVTATAAELNALNGVTPQGTELVRAADKPTARAALGLGTSATSDTGTATGNVPVLVDVGGSPGFSTLNGENLTGVNRPKVFDIPTWTVNGASTIVHGMTAEPSLVTVTLVAKVAASGWAVGEEVTVGPNYQASSPGIHTGFNGTNIWVQHYTTFPVAKAGGAFMPAANDTNWSIRVRAWL